MKTITKLNRNLHRKFAKYTALLAGAGLLTASLPAEDFPTSKVDTTGLAVTDDTVTVGQLHSATGTMAISEAGSIESERLAID